MVAVKISACMCGGALNLYGVAACLQRLASDGLEPLDDTIALAAMLELVVLRAFLDSHAKEGA